MLPPQAHSGIERKMARTTALTPREITDQELAQRENKANTVHAVAMATANFTKLTGKALPATAEDLRDYLLSAVNAGYALATITTRMALLTTWHDEYLSNHGLDRENNPGRHPSVVKRLRAVRRTIAAPQDQAEPLYFEQLEACIAALDQRITDAPALYKDERQQRAAQLTAIRDKAMFLIGFWFGLRSDSLVSLTTKNVKVKAAKTGNQLRIYLPETKATDEFERTLDALDYLCPIPALLDWLNASQPQPDDPLFVGVTRWGKINTSPIHVDSVIPMMRKVLDLAGLDSRPFTTHSLRRGASIWADSMGASTRDRMDWFGWKDPTSALKYVDAKPSLPTLLQTKERPVQQALSVLRAHLLSNQSHGTLSEAFTAKAMEMLAQVEQASAKPALPNRKP